MDTAAPGAESTPQAQQHLTPGSTLARHLHGPAYLALVVEGSYWEANGVGRRQLRAGDVAVHGPYGAHCNQVGGAGAVVLNLAVQGPLADAYGRIDDVDSLVRTAARQGPEAGALALTLLRPLPPLISDWPDQLALDMAADPQLCLGDWALRQGLAPETVSRGFRRLYGATPKRVRFEQRTRRALAALLGGAGTSLVELALEAGFADQASMNHAIRALTGASPQALRRRSSADKTVGRGAAIVAA